MGCHRRDPGRFRGSSRRHSRRTPAPAAPPSSPVAAPCRRPQDGRRAAQVHRFACRPPRARARTGGALACSRADLLSIEFGSRGGRAHSASRTSIPTRRQHPSQAEYHGRPVRPEVRISTSSSITLGRRRIIRWCFLLSRERASSDAPRVRGCDAYICQEDTVPRGRGPAPQAVRLVSLAVIRSCPAAWSQPGRPGRRVSRRHGARPQGCGRPRHPRSVNTRPCSPRTRPRPGPARRAGRRSGGSYRSQLAHSVRDSVANPTRIRPDCPWLKRSPTPTEVEPSSFAENESITERS